MTFWVAGAVVVGGAISAYGANQASHTQASAQEHAADTQLSMFNTLNAQEQPFMQAGYGATNQLSKFLAPGGPGTTPFTAKDYLNNQDPGYQFQLQTGGAAIRNADTPGVGSLSGAALKDLVGFNQGMAATGYQNAWNRWNTQNQNTYNRLYGLANLGQNAASNTGAVGSSLGTGIAQAQAAAGGSLAAGQMGVASSLGGSASTLAYLANNNANNFNNYSATNGFNTGQDPLGGGFGTGGATFTGGS